MTAWFQTQLGFGAGWFVANTILILLIALPLMLAVAMIIYADRKIWAAMALRKGPNVVGPFGLLQSFADGLKVFLQETIIPSSANVGLFLLAPIITFTVALIVWAVVPFGPGMVLSDINVGLLYILAASSLGVYGVMMAGWASNSKYPFYSALRAAAQMVSYEVSIGFVLISVVLWVGSFNMTAIVEMQRSHLWITNGFGFNPLFLPMAVVFFISSLAETARAPFDLTEAESELVAGYQTEYSSMSFALFWLGEYANVILMCALNAILFWGGYLPPVDWAPLYVIPGIFWLFLKILIFFFMFSWVKATVPRYRYDQLMRLGWKIFLPLSLVWVVLVSGYLMLTRYSNTSQTAVASVAGPVAEMPTEYLHRCKVRVSQLGLSNKNDEFAYLNIQSLYDDNGRGKWNYKVAFDGTPFVEATTFIPLRSIESDEVGLKWASKDRKEVTVLVGFGDIPGPKGDEIWLMPNRSSGGAGEIYGCETISSNWGQAGSKS